MIEIRKWWLSPFGSNDQLIGERMPPADFFIAKHDFMFCSQYTLNMLC